MGTNTGIGIGIGIPFKNNALGGDRPYLPPELKARLIGVWDNYGKKNTDADRNIIKNKIPNAGGDLEILNAAYEGMSGCNGYPVIFGINKTWKKVPTYNSIYNINDNKIHFTKILFTNRGLIFSFVKQNNQLYDITEIPSFKIKISGLKGDSKIRYSYIKTENAVYQSLLDLDNGIHELPKSLAPTDSISNDSWIGFTVTPRIENETSFDCDITIEILPEYEDAFVTDGVNDMIISQKTLQEMGVTKDFTIVSMIHQISWRGSGFVPLTNYIRPTDNIYVRNQVADIGKTGIYGYVIYDVNNTSVSNSHVINTVLGDKNDYSVYTVGNLSQGKFSVQGYIDGNDNIREISSVAHYWTFALLGKATEDDINLIIAYFNLDRTLKPDIRCNIERQGITNDNHADFNDKLIDYSGNGRDIQMYNLAWKGGSGIAAKQYETFKDWTSESSSTSIIKQIDEFTRIVESTTNGYWVSRIRRDSDLDKVYSPINVYLYQDNNFLVHECKYEVDGVKYAIPINEPVGKGYHKLEMYTKDRYTELPENAENVVLSEWYFPKSTKGSIKYSIIPSCKGGILLDGINDFGKVIDMPIYKDYTFIIDRQIIFIGDTAGVVASKSEASLDATKHGAFIFEYLGAPDNISTWSFYKDNGKVANTDFTRGISYQSKYSYNGKDLTVGTSKDSDKLWLGIIRDNDSRFFNGAIYSLMSFPYSMSEFLIERQLKKHKLGTLYPNMVEFRPVIKSSVELVNKPSFAIRGTSTLLNAGDYIPENSEIWVVITMNNAADRITKFVINGNTIDIPSSAYNPSTMKYGFPFTIDSKSPQKIGITIEQDENYVLFNPVITSNVEYHKLDFYLNNYQKKINIGDYIPKGAYLRANFYLKNNVDELTVFTFNGVNIGYRRSPYDDMAFNIGSIYNYDSPQEVNITIDEYIRYEEIVQPYPVIFQITDRNTNQRYSWGDKIKVGSSIRLNQGEKPNLLSGLYSIQSYEYEGETYSYNQLTNLNIILTKQSISLSCNKTWLLDDNEPKCILSPRLLRIPNSSYKILGYIPDISGHGNHGIIHNSAYAEMSGANGYGTNLGNWSINSANTGKIITQREEHLEYEVLSADKNILFYNTKIENDTFVIYTSVNTNIVYSKESDIIANIPANTPTKVVCPKIGTILLKTNETPTVGNIITVKQYGIYEGAYCFDGVDDFVIIPTTVGGKQVLMKVNWDDVIANAIIYDQRGYPDEFAIYNADKDNSNNPVFAYQARNTGQTYIDGILNSNIKASELKAITHNITITNELSAGVNKSSPVIGSNIVHNDFFVNMALYDFMLFDEISTDDKIKQLNEYVGIEAKVELPPYYWDAYGKTNLDADKATIQQRGVAIGDYDLTNYNHAYEGMSGYNGYPVVFGANKTWESLSGVYGYTSDVTNTTIHVTHAEHAGNSLLFSYVKKDGALANIKEIPAFRVTIGGLEGNSKFGYRYLATEDATEETLVYLGNGTHELAKSFAPTEALLDLTRNVWVGIFITPMVEGEVVFDCDITIEVLPEYENGLAYDGITDYSKNANIPVLTDYTYIYKRTIINIPTNAATLLKGADKTNGGAFIADYGNKWQFNFGQYNIIQGIADGINWQTVNSFNGTSINKGENTDDSGITVAKFSNGYTSMVFYKLILYPKTISLLEINFLKNLMEKDEIIDLNNPIFIKNE